MATSSESYCSHCDKVHKLVKCLSFYVCGAPVSLFWLDGKGYKGIHDPNRKGCRCLDMRYFDVEHCSKCRQPVRMDNHDRLMENFTRQMWREAREGFVVNSRVAEDLALTFPRQFTEIFAKSKKGNAEALAPHLPPVLTNIVVEYFWSSN
jgi:hypothetical protein